MRLRSAPDRFPPAPLRDMQPYLRRFSGALRHPTFSFASLPCTLLQLTRQVDRHLDVTSLRAFVAAGQQDYHRLSTLDEVNAISRSVIDPQLQNVFSDRLNVPRITQRPPSDARVTAGTRLSVTQLFKPIGTDLRLPHFDHVEHIVCHTR